MPALLMIMDPLRLPRCPVLFTLQPLATFLKGTIGSFSRGGLMVTHEGRVIYKINQDRGLIAHPSLSEAHHTIFGIFDGEYDGQRLVSPNQN